MKCSSCLEDIDIPLPNIIGFASIEYICLKCSGTVNDSSGSDKFVYTDTLWVNQNMEKSLPHDGKFKTFQEAINAANAKEK